jgi:hypothetical protein
MGFEEYGAFILMIVRITYKDLPVFMAVYTIFLLGVGHLHYFASNELHAGVRQGMDSVWRIFSAGKASRRPPRALPYRVQRPLAASFEGGNDLTSRRCLLQ